MPEAKDSDWDWADFVAHNNNELVATWGNLANRVLSFAYKHWEGHVPNCGYSLPSLHRPGIARHVENGFQSVGAELEAVHMRSALGETMKLATAVNQYLDINAPWTAIKTDKDSAALTIYTALKAIDSLKVLFSPFLPFTSERLHGFFGYETPLFGDQYLEEIQNSLGTHTGLRYRAPSALSGGVSSPQDVSKPAVEAYWKPSKLKPGGKLKSTRSVVQEVGGKCSGGGTGEVREVNETRMPV